MEIHFEEDEETGELTRIIAVKLRDSSGYVWLYYPASKLLKMEEDDTPNGGHYFGDKAELADVIKFLNKHY